DKGGNANVGVFARTSAAYDWLAGQLTVERLRELLPETAGLRIDRYDLPNLWSLNFVIHDLLEEGVAASSRIDAQAKSLGEWLRARVVDVPIELVRPGLR
ncbi:MAG TPA: exopolyphosphatase, partial [Ilumatobacter sp.]|nr:exopolyphosphatase [Ilumatobacter sp.]